MAWTPATRKRGVLFCILLEALGVGVFLFGCGSKFNQQTADLSP